MEDPLGLQHPKRINSPLGLHLKVRMKTRRANKTYRKKKVPTPRVKMIHLKLKNQLMTQKNHQRKFQMMTILKEKKNKPMKMHLNLFLKKYLKLISSP